ncbi:opsin-5-like isoform X1 [Daphnia pulex]|uniref:opsin-5-like isoform X1 n=1 Tax=Daphnia pulex TaxID=6669 RepID=UPI001EE1540A|nr:opsin-5-like isoform X1 [Daphnia pulex]
MSIIEPDNPINDSNSYFPVSDGDGLGDSTSIVPDKFQSIFDPWGDYVFATIMIIIGVVSLFGNGLAVHVFRRKGSEINVPEVLLLNIAVVDLFLGIASYPATIVAAFSHRWVFGQTGCTLYAFTCYFLGLATILSLTALAIFRFIKTCFPQKAQWMNVPRTRLVIFLIYVYSMGWAMMPFFGWGGYDVEPFGFSCTLAWTHTDQNDRNYILAASIFNVFLPSIVITASHLGILFKIRQASRMFSSKSAGKQSSKAEIQFIRVSFGVCFGFLIAWLPYACISLWSTYGDVSAIPLWITPIPVLLAKSSIAYNPIIYVLLTRRYRVDFSKALRELLQLSVIKDGRRITNTIPSEQMEMENIAGETNEHSLNIAIGESSATEEVVRG